VKLAPPAQVDVRAYNIGTSQETSVLELAATLKRASGSDVPIEHAPARPGELPRSAVSNEKASQALGWRPDVDLEAGLRLTYEYFAKRTRGTPS
jgi:UDP-glucose 4-epimerase